MFTHLLVPIDGTELSNRAIEVSLELATKLKARITGFVAEPEMDLPVVGRDSLSLKREADEHEARTSAHARGVLAQFEQRAKEAGVAFAGQFSRSGRVDEAIVSAAEELGCDMIVMVTHGRGTFGELLFGSQTKSVMGRTKLPLLVLH